MRFSQSHSWAREFTTLPLQGSKQCHICDAWRDDNILNGTWRVVSHQYIIDMSINPSRLCAFVVCICFSFGGILFNIKYKVVRSVRWFGTLCTLCWSDSNLFAVACAGDSWVLLITVKFEPSSLLWESKMKSSIQIIWESRKSVLAGLVQRCFTYVYMCTVAGHTTHP